MITIVQLCVCARVRAYIHIKEVTNLFLCSDRCIWPMEYVKVRYAIQNNIQLFRIIYPCMK